MSDGCGGRARARVVVTGAGAICAAGKSPAEVWENLAAGRSALAPVRQWESSSWRERLAGEVADYDARALVEDRKILKVIRRSDVLGLYAARQAIDGAGWIARRDGLATAERESFDEETAVFVGSGGGSYGHTYDFLPLLAHANGDTAGFGRDLARFVHPMWLLGTLPNNVLCHVGIRYGFKGPNGCVTNHGASGALALLDAFASLRSGEAERALVVAHEAPVEPQSLRRFDAFGLLGAGAVRPFDAERDGSALGEAGAALALETERAATERGARVFGEVLGGACTSEAGGLLPVRDDGDGPARALALALDDAAVEPDEVGVIVAHGNATRRSDAAEVAALRRAFGAATPPLTALKWAFGHTLAAAALLEAVCVLHGLGRGRVPGIATLGRPDPAWDDLPWCRAPGAARSDVAVVLARGFGGVSAALALRVVR